MDFNNKLNYAIMISLELSHKLSLVALKVKGKLVVMSTAKLLQKLLLKYSKYAL